jgi:hypothetical protein
MMALIQPHVFLLLALLSFGWLTLPNALAANLDDVFGPFTAHIQEQIQVDKKTFLRAQTCTQWFYKQLQRKPARPKVEGIAFRLTRSTTRPSGEAPECRTNYPGGLDAAREDFSRTQSLLSLSLTFYEFALVGDRNDDQRYSTAELRDILESFGLPFNAALAPAAHRATLEATFDSVYKAGGLESLMASMGKLYDKGYRLTARDRDALNRIMG